MLKAGTGLTTVSTKDLKKALSAVHRGDIVCPLSVEELTRFGLQHCASDILDMVRDLDARATRLVFVAVLAERLHGEPSNKAKD